MTVWGAMPDQSHPGLPLAGEPALGPPGQAQTAPSSGVCAHHHSPCFQIRGSWVWNPIPTMPKAEEVSLDHARMFRPREHEHLCQEDVSAWNLGLLFPCPLPLLSQGHAQGQVQGSGHHSSLPANPAFHMEQTVSPVTAPPRSPLGYRLGVRHSRPSKSHLF